MNAIRSTGLAGLLLAAVVTAPAQADDALARKDLDARINIALRDVINVGAKVFNDGDADGCFRLYQGTLMATLPLLDHRPQLKKAAEEKLARAPQLPTSADRAFALRDVIDEIRGAIRKDMPAAAPKPLWDRLGGEPAIRAVVKDFVKAAANDPKVNFTRGGKFIPDVPKLEQQLVEFVSANTGGPLKYTGREMKPVHKGMGITEAEFNAAAADLIATLKKFSVPKKEADELVAIVASTKKDIVEAAPRQATTLRDRLGGEAAVTKVVHDFVAAAAADPKVDFTRGGKFTPDVPKLEKLLVELISVNTGGPLKYSGRDMKVTHAGMKITEAEFNAAAGHLVAALKKSNVPQKEIDGLVAVVGSTKQDIVEK